MSLRIAFNLIVPVLVVFIIGCGIPKDEHNSALAALQEQIDSARGNVAVLEQRLSAMKRDKAALEAEIDTLNAELTRLAGERDANAEAVAKARARIQMFKNMLIKFKKLQESGKLKIKIANNKMIVEMASAILFDSGKAKLSEEGADAIAEVGKVLATIMDRNFQVAGHTDNVPIKSRKFPSNWHLSSARAVSVVSHLIDNGMAMENLSSAGYAETQPVASNDTEEGRAKNRRIEIVLQPNLDELPDLSSLEKMLD